MPPPVVAVVLAGGAARRLGGGDKGLIELGGRPILRWMLERLGPQAGPILLNAAGDPARFADLGLPMIPDPLPGRLGPLAGILAGLEWAEQRAAGALVLSVPTDLPFLPGDLVAALRAAMTTPAAPAAIAASAGRLHPTIGLWRPSLAPSLRTALAEEGLRKAGLWAERVGAAIATWPAEPFDPFLNINTRDDLERAMAIVAAHPWAVDRPPASR